MATSSGDAAAEVNDVAHTSVDQSSGVVGDPCAWGIVIYPEEVSGYAGAAYQDLACLLFNHMEGRDNIPSQHRCPLTHEPSSYAI